MYEKILKVCILILRGNTHYEWPAHSPSQSVTVLLTAFSALHTQRGAALPLLLALTTCYLLYHLTTYCLLLTTYYFTPGGAALPLLLTPTTCYTILLLHATGGAALPFLPARRRQEPHRRPAHPRPAQTAGQRRDGHQGARGEG